MRKRRIMSIILVIISIILIVTALIIGRKEPYTYECNLYFFNSSRTSFSEEKRNIEYYSDEDLPNEVLEELIKGPLDSQNSRVVNKRTEINSIANDGNGNLVVDFSKLIGEDNGAQNEVFPIYAVVKSLSSLDGVNSVKVTVGGREFVTRDGIVIGALRAEDINLSTDTDTSETISVRLYFTDIATKKLSVEERRVKVTDQQPIVQYIINELIKGPISENHAPVLDKGTNLISVTIADNIGFVNFGKNFIEKNSASPQKTEYAIFSIVNSMTELETVNRVQFLVEGKKTEKIGDIDISHPIGRNNNIIGNGGL